MMKLSLKNESGFSMIQALVLTGMVSGIALMGTQFTSNAKYMEKGASSRDNLELFHEKISEAFANQEKCTKTIIQNAKQIDIVGLNSLSLNEVWSEDALLASVGGIYMNNSVSLESMNVLAPNLGSTGTRNVEISYGRLMQETAKRTGVGFGGKNLKKSISLRVIKDATGGFVGCYAIASAKTDMNSTSSGQFQNDISKQLCEQMSTGATNPVLIWNEAKSRCELGGQCPTGQVYYGIDVSGNYKCTALSNWVNLNSSIDPTVPTCVAGDQIQLQVISGKMKLTCLSGGGGGTGSTSGGTTGGGGGSKPPLISYAGATGTSGTLGTAFSVAPTTLNDNGAAILSCSISPGLPSGLSIDPSICLISGVPIGTSPSTTYTITATNSVGSSSATVVLIIKPTTPSFTYSGSSGTSGTVGVAMSIYPSALDNGGEAVTCTSSALPSGFSLNPTTCAISGTPSTSFSAVITVTATNSAGSSNASVAISASVLVSKPTISYAASTGTSGKQGSTMEISPSTLSNNGASISCSVSPSLPAGLIINAVTCMISGTPSAMLKPSTFTVTATNSAGSTSTSVTLVIVEGIPTLSYSASTGTIGSFGSIMSVTPSSLSSNGAPISSCTSTPALPTGLSLDTGTCVISGTPSVVIPLTTYNIVATNSAGSSSPTPVSLRINAGLPSISYLEATGTNGSRNAPMSITPTTLKSNGASITNCTVSPILPTGLSINTSTCVISGTPTVAKVATTYTVTATNSVGSSSADVSISVSSFLLSQIVQTSKKLCGRNF